MRKTSRTVSIDVDVELDEFNTKDLIEELRDRGIISEPESKKLLTRKEGADQKEDGIGLGFDLEWLAEARWRAARGELRESLIFLTRADPDLRPLLRLAP